MVDSALRHREPAATTRWYEILLAVALVAVLAAAAVSLAFWLNSPDAASSPDDANWRRGGRATAFLVVMVIAAIIACVAFVVALLGPARARGAAAPLAVTEETSSTAEPTAVYTPAGTRLIGLGGLGISVLLLGWIYLSNAAQHALMSSLVYPATFAVALVLLFDKATRNWHVKSKAESVREWLLCDTITFFLLLGVLNLDNAVTEPAEYKGFFWDMLHIALFFAVFWLLDRTRTRYRFLLANGYFVVLTLLLLIWQYAHGAAAPEGLSWWSTIWPFLILSVVFFVLEIIALLATRGNERHAVPAIKDALFVFAYAVLLISAIPPIE